MKINIHNRDMERMRPANCDTFVDVKLSNETERAKVVLYFHDPNKLQQLIDSCEDALIKLEALPLLSGHSCHHPECTDQDGHVDECLQERRAEVAS